jgi:hypothetical protein
MSLLLLLNPDNQRPSPRFVKAARAQETDEVTVVLLTIEHPQLNPPARICSDAVDLVSRGETFKGGIPFEYALPDEDPERQVSVRLSLDILDQALVVLIRTIPPDPRPTVTLEVVMAATPDIVEAGPYIFELVAADWDVTTAEFEIGFEDLLNEMCPAQRFLPSTHPGLF